MSSGPPPRDEAGFEPAARSAVRESALRGVRWITLSRVAAELLTFGSAVLLAHLVPPAALGRAAIALVPGAFAAAPFFRGFGSPLVQRQRITREDIETAFALSVGAGALLTALVVVLAGPAFAPLFGQRTGELFRLSSLLFVLSSLGVVPQSLLLRRLDFRSTSIAEVGGLVAGAAVAVGLAVDGLDEEAVVGGVLAGAAASSLLTFAFAPVPLPRWRTGRAASLVSFGGPAGLASLLNATRANLDYLILGAKLAPAQVGFYYRAYGMGIGYQEKVTGIMMRMAFPIYSRSADVEDMRALRLRITRLHAAVLLPLLTLFIVVAPQLVPWLFGSRWEPSVVPAQVLAVGGMAVALASGSGSAILAAGRTWRLVVFNGSVLLAVAVIVLLTASSGITAVAIGVAVVRVAGLIAAYRLMLQPVIGVQARRLWGDVLPGAVSSLALAAVAVPLIRLMDANSVPVFLALCATGVAGGLAYLAVLRSFFSATMADVAALARRVMRGDRGRREPVAPARVPDPANA